MISRIRRVLRVRRQRVFYLCDPDDIVAVNAKAAIIDITEVTLDNIDRVADFRSERYVGTFRRLLEGGQYGVYAWRDLKVVGHAWAKVCRGCHCRVNGYMDIRQNEALIHFCSVSQDQRGRNIYPAMLGALCQRLFTEASVSRVFIDTDINNQASLRGIGKVGFRPLGTGLYILLLGHLVFKRFVYWEGEAHEAKAENAAVIVS
jgi:RimJ/RimL family protein N-acetyltransferase